ncbi:hypothetical protein LOD99_5008 [Oopsacas minuta]|uniref:Sodium/calcium exchanger membrane region domain-containing protein n=1 Tax=Oopsacas minuta TaxID=111878 RepID=A0AAV7JTJ9_9METZ|nr:hypothetical protein LOD99_5008 [Oopsacas minuta]
MEYFRKKLSYSVKICFLAICVGVMYSQTVYSSVLLSKASNNTNSSSWLDHCDSNVFPCSDKIVGNIVLIIFYGLTLAFAAKLISDGAELLLDLGLPAGLIGGVILPILGAVPDCAMIAVSGLGPKDEAQTQLSVGMGTLAGSTILLLSVAWSVSLLLGRVDLVKEGNRTVGIDKQCTGFSLYKQGAEISKQVTVVAIIMMITAFPYLIVQSADWVFGATKLKQAQPLYVKYAALVTMIICLVFFVMYIVIQVIMSVKIGTARVNRHQKKMVAEAAKAFYMTMFDKKINEKIGQEEKNSLLEKKYFGAWKIAAATRVPDSYKEEDEEQHLIPKEKEEKNARDPKWLIAIKSISQLVIGVFMVTFFSDPMCNALSAMTDVRNIQHIPISSFYLSFIITPVCSNASELVSSFIFALKKEKENIALTYAQLYGAATMNNTLCLAVFAGLVYFRDLEWFFSAEVTVILLVEFTVGITALAFFRIYYVFLLFFIILLYPLSLAIVVLLENLVHWG